MESLSATMISVSDMMEDEFACLSDYGNLPPFLLKIELGYECG